MWIPNNAAEIEHAARSGDLEETSSFDAKRALPAAGKNASLAIDVAAMSTDGGVILYGLGEDEHERLTLLAPIELAGAADRVDQIVATSVAEVPHVRTREYRCADDATRGYLAVIVPQSSRAPHQVTVGRDLRFYGRGPRGNRILTEGEVARLYQRRERWEENRDELLTEAIAQAPFQRDAELAYLHGFARPVAPDRSIWRRAAAACGGRDQLLQQLVDAARATKPDPDTYAPHLGPLGWQRQGSDEWLLSSYDGEKPRAEKTANARVNVDGRGLLFCGRAAEVLNPHNAQPPDTRVMIFEVIIAGNTASFLAIMGALYRLADYYGHVDVGVCVQGLRGGVSYHMMKHAFIPDEGGYSADSYPRHERIAAAELRDPEVVAERMLGDLFEATTGRENFNAFV